MYIFSILCYTHFYAISILCKSYGYVIMHRYNAGMRFSRNFSDLEGHSRGYHRSGLIFMGGGGRGLVGTINCVYVATQSLIITCSLVYTIV